VMIRDEIIKVLQSVTKEKEVHLEIPEIESHGDYSSNIAMQQVARVKEPFDKAQGKQESKRVKDKNQSPHYIAEEIVKKLRNDKELNKLVEKIEVAGPGFINFWLSKNALLNNISYINEKKEKFGQGNILKGKRYLLEHTSPNTIKTLHVGHVRNNVLGMAVHNLLETNGAEVYLDAVNNDRGIHVMKAIWAYLKYGEGKVPDKDEKPDQFVDKFYVKGAKEAEDKKAKEEMQELLRKWEGGDLKIRTVWKKLRDWTLKGFEESYKRLGSHHDRQWFESDYYEGGKKIVEEGLKKGVFKKLPDGAVLSQLKKYNLPDTIVLRADGTSMYHTQDLRLTELKRKTFPSDLYIWDIGPEQTLYLKQLFAMCEQLGIGKRSDYLHLSYGFVFLKTGEKMSSREGNVISADWLMDEMVGRAKKIIERSETPRHRSGQASRGLTKGDIGKVAEEVGIGAIKYGFLKTARETDIHFDLDESLSLEGNSAPYLQYTVARTQSVLAKSKRVREQESKRYNNLAIEQFSNYNNEELLLLRSFIHFPEIIEAAATNYSPNLLCNYLFDLAQKFNNFYNQHRILDKVNGGEWVVDGDKSNTQHTMHYSPNTQDFRLALTSATGQILKNGLMILGIETPGRM